MFCSRHRGLVPLSLILYGLLALTVAGAFLTYRHSLIEQGRNEVYTEWKQAADAQKERERAQIGKAADKLVAQTAKARVVYRTITQEVERVVEKPVYRNVCLDDDGLRLARAAIGGGEGTAAGGADKPVPKAAGAGGRPGGDGAALDR